MPALIFDCDGVLADTEQYGHLPAFNQTFADFDVPGSPYFVQVHGPTGKVRGEGTGPDWDQVSSLLSQATGDAELEVAIETFDAADMGATIRAGAKASSSRAAEITRQLRG